MNKLIISAALAASALSLPTVALAQRAGQILIVDSDRVLTDCAACKSATSQLQVKQSAAQTQAQQLQEQLQTEAKPLKAAVDALNGKEPGPALKLKITAFQTKQQQLNNLQDTFKSTVANVQQQIGVKLVAVVEQVRARRGASIVLSKHNTIANDTAIEVTGEGLAVEALGLAGSGKLVYFMAIEGAKFRQPVEPGVLLRLDVEFIQKRASVCKFAGRASVDGKLAAEANFTAMIADPPA